MMKGNKHKKHSLDNKKILSIQCIVYVVSHQQFAYTMGMTQRQEKYFLADKIKYLLILPIQSYSSAYIMNTQIYYI